MIQKRGAERRRVEWSWSDDPILLPLAFQPREWNAVYVAVFLAEYSGSRVEIFNVETGPKSSAEIEFTEKLRRFTERSKVEAIFSSAQAKKPPSVSEIASRIVKAAEEKHVQTIVMSAHREPFFTEFFGRVSDRVARSSQTRVLLVETPRKGIEIRHEMRRILVPVLRSDIDPDPFMVAAALTSSATIARAELVAARFVKLPMTTPLDAIEVSKTLRNLEQEFSKEVGDAIRSLGRIFTPRIVPVREFGPEVSTFASEMEADLMVMDGRHPPRIGSLLSRTDYDIVKRSACPILVIIPPKKG